MIVKIESEELMVEVSDLGAELQSVRSKDGREYLWQGDSPDWPHRAPNLFPIIGRLHDQSYIFQGEKYRIAMHGFVWTCQLELIGQGKNWCSFWLGASEETRKSYPFDFVYEITYRVEKDTLRIQFQETNRDCKTMYFAVGGHPSFRVPMEDGLVFEDYYLDFEGPVKARKMEILANRMYSGRDLEFPLEDSRRLPLNYHLFDENALVLRDVGHEVTLRSDCGEHGLRLSFPDMRYLGVWSCLNGDSTPVAGKPISERMEYSDFLN